MNSLSTKPRPAPSIAVLPFLNMSGNSENEYFSDGISEEIINALTRIPGLKVTARTSSFAFKGKEADIRAIGQHLGVQSVLEGSVRQAGRTIRISAKLIQTEDGFPLWSKNFDRQLTDLFAVQDEISLLIADKIRENFGHLNVQDHLVKVSTDDITAYDLYLKARYNHLKWNGEGISKAIALYEQCIKQDPDFALPYFGIGYCYSMRASWSSNSAILDIAEQYINRGVALDRESYLGFYAQGTAAFWGRWEFGRAEQYYLEAIDRNPSFTEAEEGLVEMYTAIGAFDKAKEHVLRILTLNPLSANHYYTKGVIHCLEKDYEEALESMLAALRVDPGFSFAVERAILCYLLLGQYAEMDAFLKAHPEAEVPELCRLLYQLVYPDQETGRDMANIGAEVSTAAPRSLLSWTLFLQVHMGHHELALDMLERGIVLHSGQYVNFRYMPLLEPLHQYERFQKMVEQTFRPENLPEEPGTPVLEKAGHTALLSEEEIKTYSEKVQSLFEEQSIYLDQSLNLKSLADQVDLHPNKLSWLLNIGMGQNFNEYVNAYRLKTFKRLALDPEYTHLTLLALAYESGFNSKTVFNSFFKKQTGLTPRAWVKAKKS